MSTETDQPAERHRRIVIANGQEIELPPQAWVIVPRPGIKIRVPNYTVINSRTTIDYMHKLEQPKWTHIVTGPLFRDLFETVFDPKDGGEGCYPPEDVTKFPDTPDDVLHISGLIISAFEAMTERHENVYFDKPEEHLHPAQARCLMSLIYKLRRLAGIKDDVPFTI